MESNRIKSEMDVDGYAVKCEESLNEMIINRVRVCQALWNIKHKKFRDTVYKKILWTKIGQELGVNEAFLRTRWRTLRDRYLKEKKKFERQRRVSRNSDGQSTSGAAGQPWSLLPLLDFLRDSVHPRTKHAAPCILDSSERVSRKEECPEETEEQEIISDSKDHETIEDPLSPEPSSPTLSPAGFSHIRSSEASSPEELFYMSIARTVEGLDEWTRLLIRQDVMAVVAKHIREARIRRSF